jgi:hypothetical protein
MVQRNFQTLIQDDPVLANRYTRVPEEQYDIT